MRMFGKILTAALLLFFLSVAPSTAEIISLKLRSDNRNIILFSEFRFSNSGYVSINVSSASATSPFPLPPPDPSRIGFFILPHELLYQYDYGFNQSRGLCALDNKFVKVLFTFRDLSPPPQSSFNISYHVTYPNMYSLCFVNCNLSHVTMDVHTELYNSNDNGTTKDYLSAGLAQPRSPYITFSIIYQCFLVIWIFLCIKYWRSYHMIHVLMGALLVISSIHFIYAAMDQHYIKETGTHHGWDVSCYRIQSLRSAVFFTVMVFTGVGYGFWNRVWYRPILVLMIVSPLQYLANLASIKAQEFGPFNDVAWMDWITSYYIANTISYLAVFSSNFISAHLVTQGLAKIVYGLFTVVVGVCGFLILLFSGLFNGELRPWVVNVPEETFTLILCMVMFYIFRPYDDMYGNHELWGKRNLENNRLPT